MTSWQEAGGVGFNPSVFGKGEGRRLLENRTESTFTIICLADDGLHCEVIIIYLFINPNITVWQLKEVYLVTCQFKVSSVVTHTFVRWIFAHGGSWVSAA